MTLRKTFLIFSVNLFIVGYNTKVAHINLQTKLLMSQPTKDFPLRLSLTTVWTEVGVGINFSKNTNLNYIFPKACYRRSFVPFTLHAALPLFTYCIFFLNSPVETVRHFLWFSNFPGIRLLFRPLNNVINFITAREENCKLPTYNKISNAHMSYFKILWRHFLNKVYLPQG